MDVFLWFIALFCFVCVPIGFGLFSNRYYDAGAILIFISVVGFAVSCLFLSGYAGSGTSETFISSSFKEKRGIVSVIQSAKFDITCDRSGVDNTGAALRANCYEKEGFRVWRIDGKLYLATVLGDGSNVDMIVDEDKLASSSSNAIIYWSEHLDLRKLLFAIEGASAVRLQSR